VVVVLWEPVLEIQHQVALQHKAHQAVQLVMEIVVEAVKEVVELPTLAVVAADQELLDQRQQDL
jgi:hypothetical protein